MNDNLLILVKLLTGLVGVFFMLWLIRRPELFSLSQSSFNRAICGTLLLLRLGVFVFIYCLLRANAHSNITLIYPWTSDLLSGKELYTAEVPSCYSPLYLYFTALPVIIWPSFKSIILQSILFELIAFSIWLSVGRRLFSEQRVRLAAIFYITSALPLWSVAVCGDNQSWVSLLLGLAVLCFLKERHVQSGVWLGLSVAAVKFLPLMYVPAFILNPRRLFRWSFGFMVIPLVVFGIFCWLGFDILLPVRVLSGQHSSGNLPFLFSILGIHLDSSEFQTIASVMGIGALAGTVITVFLTIRACPYDKRRVIYMITLIQMVFMLVSRKSHTAYLVMCFMPICYVISLSSLRAKGYFLLGVFQVVAAVEQSFWFRTMQMRDFSIIWDNSLPKGVSSYTIGTVLIMQIVVLVFYSWCAWLSWKFITKGVNSNDRNSQPTARIKDDR